MSFFISSEGAPAGGAFDTEGTDMGLAKADQHCQTLANAAYGNCPAQTARTWHAYLSTSLLNGDGTDVVGTVIHARDRIGDGPYIDYSGSEFAEDLADLYVNGVRPENAFTELGQLHVSTVQNLDLIWTGSDSFGRTVPCYNPQGDAGCIRPPDLVVADTCANWTDLGNLGQFGHQGMPSTIPGEWSYFDKSACLTDPEDPDADGGPEQGSRNGQGRIYCFALD